MCSALETLRLVELKECLVSGAGSAPLQSLLPRLTQLHLSDCLLSSWQQVADITSQLPRLYMLNLRYTCLTYLHVVNQGTRYLRYMLNPRYACSFTGKCAPRKVHMLHPKYM